MRWLSAALFLLVTLPGSSPAARWQESPTELTRAIDAALDYLAAEVPAWRSDNGCFSCHNNGDGVRALYEARRAGWNVPDISLEDSNGWLAAPRRWAAQPGEPGVKDLRLAQIQFSRALMSAVDNGLVTREPLRDAARELLRFQGSDGSWADPNETLVGSPATYGAMLSTLLAMQLIREVLPAESAAAARAAAGWLLAREPVSTVDRSCLLPALRLLGEPEESRTAAVEALLQQQGSGGGWGPYKGAPAEVFDTAIAVLALAGGDSSPGLLTAIDRGTTFLVSEQLPSGGWTETTRPSGGESYAQHISTTAWATIALLEISQIRAGSGRSDRPFRW